MDCTVISEQLIAYHFATCEDEARDSVDLHLLACTGCLRQYLALKHHLERGQRGQPGSKEPSAQPSERARLKLRAEVLATFRPSVRVRVSSWLARPIPLYQGVAAAVVAVVVVALSLSPRAARPTTSHGEYVDTSRPTAESLSVY